MDAPPAVNRPPLRNPSPILGSGSLSPLPVTDVPPPLRKAGAWFDSRRKHRCFSLCQRPPDPATEVNLLGCLALRLLRTDSH
jgi:hypothetical protein